MTRAILAVLTTRYQYPGRVRDAESAASFMEALYSLPAPNHRSTIANDKVTGYNTDRRVP